MPFMILQFELVQFFGMPVHCSGIEAFYGTVLLKNMSASVDLSIADVFIVRTVLNVSCLVRRQFNVFRPVSLSC